jgi:hypothetical protein
MRFVKDCMTDDFKILSGDVNPQEALTLLANQNYGVIENATQQPIGTVTVAEIEGAIAANETAMIPNVVPSASLLTVGCELEMQTVLNSPLLTTLAQDNRPAVVIDNSQQVVGILTAEAIRQFIQGGWSQERGITLGPDPNTSATQLAGAFAPLTAYFICRECWTVNELSAEEWAAIMVNPPPSIPICQNLDEPHLLKLI